jgi:IS1 family transposase
LNRNEKPKKAKADHHQSLSRASKFARLSTPLPRTSPKHFEMDRGSRKGFTKTQRYFAASQTRSDDVLEYDEAWSFVFKKLNKRWLWTVMCRRTRQIIAFTIGDRSEKTCRQLWKRVPEDYRGCISYSDFWEAYQKVLPEKTHHPVRKDSGQTNHMERWYCTLRQHQARYVRKTLSFSKKDAFHHMVTKWFIVDHNLAIKQSVSLTL